MFFILSLVVGVPASLTHNDAMNNTLATLCSTLALSIAAVIMP
jgi:hypothetical protein